VYTDEVVECDGVPLFVSWDCNCFGFPITLDECAEVAVGVFILRLSPSVLTDVRVHRLLHPVFWMFVFMFQDYFCYTLDG
jgi:hypothetical protein